MSKQEPYPYQIHTNSELELMLAGKKPFAVFAHERVDGFEKSDALSNQNFDEHVARGAMSEHMRTVERSRPDGSTLQIDYYFYAMPGEEWRVNAYCLLNDALHNHGWCANLERLEGTLLGYTEEQNDYHIARKYKRESNG